MFDRGAHTGLLVSIPLEFMSVTPKDHLNQAGTIDAGVAFSTPEVRGVQEGMGSM